MICPAVVKDMMNFTKLFPENGQESLQMIGFVNDFLKLAMSS